MTKLVLRLALSGLCLTSTQALAANMAEETLGSVRGDPKTRTKEKGFATTRFHMGARVVDATAFSNPSNPVRPRGVPITSSFPPGVVTETPIVFE
ncbi:hypothetical protein CA13_73310 [Planctomycetes bacterium CA13]|uniref:Uncharacterized protein n=1 Tax=Novipirellula herctigrandis TaxID=2527986 RepID=A0A5C5YLX7_9BACT|nr:hypothetical protein CA13_73310 [Planctomycetes bacterium CA13]